MADDSDIAHTPCDEHDVHDQMLAHESQDVRNAAIQQLGCFVMYRAHNSVELGFEWVRLMGLFQPLRHSPTVNHQDWLFSRNVHSWR